MLLNFALPRALPGDPLRAILSPEAPTYVSSDIIRAELAEFYGLDKPLLHQLGEYIGRLSHGDLGLSIQHNVPVTSLISQRLPWTLLLVGSAALLATLVSVPFGVQSGWRRAKATDRFLTFFFVALECFPVFFVASLAAFIFSVELRWFPLAGARTRPLPEGGALVQVMDIVHHLALPGVVLALQFTTTQFLA
ncbi:MAG: ABC transporter permease, partial [Acidobacteria bacterium]|nr:ABC transporter permease [Acidobacteriota bacterium]